MSRDHFRETTLLTDTKILNTKENMKKTASKPIGIFDSGLGGLTVLQEIRKLLPGVRRLRIKRMVVFPSMCRAA